jgi:alginate O-acetyltransferase complex protein AlgI
MLFNSLPFLFVFLPITYLVFWRLKTPTQRYVWLTVTGYVFYSFWNYKFCALLAFSTIVSYLAGLGLLRWTDPRTRRLCLVVSVSADLAVLGFFKYANFGLSTAAALGRSAGVDVQFTPLDIVLPIGISFYTFHSISYIVDAYRGTITPTRNFWEYATYVSLFSQLVAGPIVRFREIEADLEQIDRTDRRAHLNRGWSFFAIGLIEKVVIADSIAAIINPALERYAELSTVDTWLCMIGYAYQLFFDFAGYSDMAVGLGYLFGIRIPQNFRSPYQAVNIADFWRRWHMSLSSWLRDYVFMPLGGVARRPWKQARNLLVTMALAGLWHGAAWTFVVWGVYHGVLMAAYGAVGRRTWDRLPRVVAQVATFVLVLFGWVVFRATTMDMAGVMFRKMFFFESGFTVAAGGALVVMLLIAGALAHAGPNSFELKHQWSPRATVAIAVLFVICIGAIYGGKPSPFLYFQF